MEGSDQEQPIGENSSEQRKDRPADNSSLLTIPVCGVYRLFDRQLPLHQLIGGGKAADIILWKCWGVTVVIVVVATVAWLVFERSGLSFLTISSDVLLILIILRFIWVNSSGVLNKSLSPLPELVLSEEMVNSAAASFRVKVNSMLLVAHDIAHGKDFRSFFQVVVFLWLFSVIGSFFSFATIAYIDFDIEIKDKKGVEYIVDDHLPRIEATNKADEAIVYIGESFHDEGLFPATIIVFSPWFADYTISLAVSFPQTYLSNKEEILQ